MFRINIHRLVVFDLINEFFRQARDMTLDDTRQATNAINMLL